LDQKDLPVKKYGGSTYWDTGAYCILLYGYKDQQVARNLLTQPVDKAIKMQKTI
jgi:trehalose/maltose hydrolase-like predicted phosphorylase